MSITCQNIELSVYSPSLSSWDDYYPHTLDDRIGAKDLSEFSFLSTYSPNIISLPWSHSASYNDLDFGNQVEVKKDINAADFNHFPLALTLEPEYLLWLKIAKMTLNAKIAACSFVLIISL